MNFNAGENSNLLLLRLPPQVKTGPQKSEINKNIATFLARLKRYTHPNIAHPEWVGSDKVTGGPILQSLPYPSSRNIIDHLTSLSATSLVSDRTRLLLLTEICNAILFLHQKDIVHGDIRGFSIIIDNDGHAVLINTGINNIINSVCDHLPVPDNVEWMSPELLETDEIPSPTKESDVYAFARTTEEVFSLQRPFAHVNCTRLQLVSKLRKITSAPPIQPKGMNNDVWNLIKSSLAVIPQERPSFQWLYDNFLVYTANGH